MYVHFTTVIIQLCILQNYDLKGGVASKIVKDTECTRKFSLSNITNSSKYITRCTRGDARSFFCTCKRICMHKTTFLRIYSNNVLKVILNCMNMQIATQLIMMYNL